jgi:hypothetical protein
MITSVTYKPSYLQGAYNPIIWSFFSDKILQPDFKYVIDVYQNGVKILRLKQRPNPSGYGMVDISMIVQGYLQVNNPNSPLAQGETTINYNTGELFESNGTLSGHYFIKVGEEYNSGSGLLIYNGVTNSVGEPAYEIYSNKTGYTSLPIHVWPATVDYRRQQYAMSNYTAVSGAYGLDPINNRVYDHGYAETITRLAYPLMENSLTQDLYTFDKMVLSFINWSAYPSTPDMRTIYGFRYKFYDAAGTLVNTSDIPVITSRGAGPRTICSTTITDAQLDEQYDIIHVLASPEDVVTAIGGSAAVQAGGRMEIQGYAKGSGCTFLKPITENVVINLLEYCEPALYPRVRLSWLNTLGGRDYLNFTMFTEKTTNVTQQSYSQEEINWSSPTPVPLGVTAPPQNLATQGGDKIYNKQAITSFKISSDWLPQDQVDLLEGLVKSPQVLAYIHSGAAFDDDFPYQVNVKQASYTSKNVRQTKLVQATFDVEVTITQKIQNT